MEDFSNTFWTNDAQPMPIFFGVHLTKMSVLEKGIIATPTPNCFHQDGELFTFAHLMHRTENTEGGTNHVGCTSIRNKRFDDVNPNDILMSFRLNEFSDSFAVYDPAVTHHVEPIFKNDDSILPAERAMIFVEFSPMCQVI